ncbi:MAG: hypothetical protein AAF978_01195, partial [Cyanobacteria bacterium P01_E01_bin.48]
GSININRLTYLNGADSLHLVQDNLSQLARTNATLKGLDRLPLAESQDRCRIEGSHLFDTP